ncbi:hypothetical protein N9Q05_02310 [bacterium]|nr:hypothetical protein [bacterium]
MCWFRKLKINRLTKYAKSMQQYRQLNQPSDEVVHKEIAIYIQLAAIYHSLLGKKKFPFAREQELDCYRAAATMDDANAQFLLGKCLLEEAKYREETQNGVVFASDNNAQRMRELYEESHKLLTTSSAMNHIQAKRFLGLCYINGWGVDVDKAKGFDLIVASIEQENSWDRVQKVFAEIGINKPAFFSELFQHRNKK